MLKLFTKRYILLSILFACHAIIILLRNWVPDMGNITHILGIIQYYVSLTILPLMYDILCSAVTYQKPGRITLLNYLPAMIVAILSMVGYFVYGTNTDNPLNRFNTQLYNVILCLQVLFFIVVTWIKFYCYGQNIHYFYVDHDDTDYPYVRNICIFNTLSILLAYIEILFTPQLLYNDIVIVIAYLALLATIIVSIGYNLHCITGKTLINPQPTTSHTQEEVLEITRQQMSKLGLETLIRTGKDNDLTDPNNPETKIIERKINNWLSRKDKPYLNEGITLNAVADELNLNSRTLSLYINAVMKQNFNNWINTLRIEEAKRIIENDTNLSILSVAVKCGFADSAMLSKNFKRIAGCTPTAYKQELKDRRAEA